MPLQYHHKDKKQMDMKSGFSRLLGLGKRQKNTLKNENEVFIQAILNSVSAEIAVLNRDGVIIAVNDPWRRFALENSINPGRPVPGTGVGVNYLELCFQPEEAQHPCGIRAVIDGQLPSFSLEYPCDSPWQKRWFRMDVTPLRELPQGGCVITHTDITKRKVNEIKQRAYLNRIKEISRHLVSLQEDMRRRLSQELHDRTSSNLAAISLNLNIVVAELAKYELQDISRRLEDTRALIDDTVTSIREISFEMRPSLLDYAGLVATVESYVQRFEQRTGITIEIDWGDKEIKYEPDLETFLFRIIQEALTNCAKHAQAKTIKIVFGTDELSNILSISDDGIGFDPAQLGSSKTIGIGLLNMRELSEVIGCQLIVESAVGIGTLIVVKFHKDKPADETPKPHTHPHIKPDQ